MNLFDGQFKSRPSINLAGSSSNRSRETIIAQAILERKKREAERQQQLAVTRIQAFYRSYAVRKGLRHEYRIKFNQLFSSLNLITELDKNLKTLLSYFVIFYEARLDQECLQNFSQFVLKHKECLIKLIISRDSSAQYSLCKLLCIHLNSLRNPIILKHSLSLRLIDYFTDSDSYSALGYIPGQFEQELALILKFLINNGFINSLIDYGIQKIPRNCENEYQAPLIYSIGHLLKRIFLFFKQGLIKNNEIVVSKLCSELFKKCQSEPQAKTILKKLSQALTETILKERQLNNKSQLSNLIEFIKALRALLTSSSFEGYQYADYMSVLYCVLNLTTPLLDSQLTDDHFRALVDVLQSLIIKILTLDLNFETKANVDENQEDEEEDMDIVSEANVVAYDSGSSSFNSIECRIQREVFEHLDSRLFADRFEMALVACQEKTKDCGFCFTISYIFYFMLKIAKLRIHESNMLRKVAFNKFYLNRLWRNICQLKTGNNNAKNEISYLQVLVSGNLAKLSQEDLYKIVAPLSTFSSLYNLFLLPILDDEFLNGEAIFSKSELIKMGCHLKDVCLGIIQLMHPDTASTQTVNSSITIPECDLYKKLSRRQLDTPKNDPAFLALRKQAMCFTHLFQQCVQLVQRLYTRDIRTGFCETEMWMARNFKLVSFYRISDILQSHGPAILTNVRFGQASHLFQQTDDMFENKLNVNDIRSLTILQELPFTVAFKERIQILDKFLSENDTQRHSINESTCRVRIRRDFLYEDAFDNLSVENCPNMKSVRLVIEMVNQHGLDEAGIDGGGVLREFINLLIETSFDPTRGFFVLTSDGFLYPNPNVAFIVEEYEAHYFFLGRILGKAIQCKILTPLKFAMFFLQKILVSKSRSMDARLDIDYLVSLDSEIYKNLLYLKDSNKIQDLELNFTLNSSEFGETKTIELKPGGSDIFVNDDNKIEYIHLVADYKLNKQINRQVIAFRNGISNVIDLELLRFFNFNEFQFLISGSDECIDVEDWKKHTVYAGVYGESNPVIKNFWKVVESFDDEQRRKLLKFVTSRSRTPLFGFKNLIPNFAIHSSGNELRLPTASTCMNLLKLPPIEEFEILKEKLICAIESDSGFELS